ncbi:polysaccharide biosynthesis protein [Salinarimonas ramus]|uniref:Polysaccharide biosynthesis protein CapD n=1 Tax=Salinarimonas ramus TaxID=690164 RepID=A0A917Q4F4_9HYPH|nr:nucleoside-diphosphate sugar epimerase/dehydratase [Salinarimonas ramus]GGK20310.1 polysaccharide biosynthesis protein CapD [Salinarimonas ramus]
MARWTTEISWKRLLASVHDVVMAGLAMTIALAARYGLDDLPDTGLAIGWVAGTMAIAAVVFRLFGLGRGMWRFASITDLRAIVLATATTLVVFVIALFLVNRLEAFPRTAPLIAWFVMVVLVGAPRLAYRALKDGGLASIRPRDLSPTGVEDVLIIGSATEADRVIRTYELERSRRCKVRGIIDYKPNKRGREVRGVPIVGDVSEFEGIVARLSRGGITLGAAILAAPQSERESIHSLAAVAARIGLPLRRVVQRPLTGDEPDLAQVTLEDLLGRPPVRLDLENIRTMIAERVVLVTGAGGSIGSELARQIAARRPARLLLVDSSEYALYEIDQALQRHAPGVPRTAIIADVRDRERVRAILRRERPALVFHAAALKHVPLVEANPCEGALTNVAGTRNVADACVETDVEAMVMISTDKAIRPTSVMGATKRAAEAYCQALDVSGVATRFVTVRFGNVLGSTGSVVPLFRRQIEAGGPVTVTHEDMRRYFMTVTEAVELVLQAAASGVARPEQRGRISVLDMGEPVRIIDLARTMIALSGLRPDRDISVAVTGLRPGEKLFEELFEQGETTVPAGADGVFVATARLDELPRVRALLDDIERAARAEDADGVRAGLATLSPTLPVASRMEGAVEGAREMHATPRTAEIVRLEAGRS